MEKVPQTESNTTPKDKAVIENNEASADIPTDASSRGTTHFDRLARTALINISFIVSLGLGECSRGPALLDLKEVYDTTVEALSVFLVISSVGSILGCFLVGFLMSRFPNGHDFILFVVAACLGVCTCLYPFCGHLYVFYVLQFFSGCFGAALDAGGNIMCLSVWRGLNGGPYMHSIHFSFAFGAFLAPVVIAPFLSAQTNGQSMADNSSSSNATGRNNTNIAQESSINVYYPMVGISGMFVSLGFLFFAVQSWKRRKCRQSEQEDDKPSTEDCNPGERMSLDTKLMVSLLVLFFFCYVGIEYVFALYLTAFAVESDLKMSKLDGNRLFVIFWGAFSVMRFLAIFAAIKVNPTIIMVFSFALCGVGSAMLLLLAQSSWAVLQVSTGVMGAGMASVYATGLLWLEGFTPVTSGMGALFTVAASLGPDLFPLLVGQFIQRRPMLMMHVTAAVVAICVALFAAAYFFGRRSLRARTANARGGQSSKNEVEQAEMSKML